ncbi:MAG: Re/Si-specific NAD(P)(+) transhydrogenase subunit alpha [Gammaproteobacteria bacterium]|nr:Re/Si-specific NAD(P)(+) transhydrogenase subunit alpha [Gammaproteobacteria bacterium]
MKVAIIKERGEEESRVAASPESVKKLAGLGLGVVVESGAGARAHFSDDEYRGVGADIAGDADGALAEADVLLTVERPSRASVSRLRRGALLIGQLAPYGDRGDIDFYAECGIDAFAMELMPRISRAQSMDVLSSQSNLAGYKAVIDAAAVFDRAMPMMMTAAGTVAPARVLVLGAGVAGLQAIATARRLGAIVSATDVRPVAKEQVESLGATFVMVESEETAQAETAGGYAKEMSEDYKRRQAELVAETLKKQDIVICTALIPGRPAPVLVTRAMAESMRPGSIIVDLAVEQGGNCELSRPGEIVDHQGVRIIGHRNVPGRLPVDASALYARNLFNFVAPFVNAENGAVAIDWEDELITGTALTRDGSVVHPLLTDTADSKADKTGGS